MSEFTEAFKAWLLSDPARASVLKALSDEVASASAAAAGGSASAEGCPDREAAGNPNAVAASVVPTKSDSAALIRIIRDLRSLVYEHHGASIMRDEDYECRVCVRKEMAAVLDAADHAIRAADAGPASGQRAGRDNGSSCAATEREGQK